MAEDIELQQIVVNGMIIKMCRDNICRHIIRRVLYRRKRIDILAERKYDDPSRMLTGTPSDSGASLYDPVNLAVTLSLFPLFKIILNIAKGSLIGKRANGARAERLPVPEYDFCIFVRVTLVIPGKVQVDIWFLVALETEERLKRDIKAVLYELLPAYGAHLIRHIPAAPSCICPYFFGIKIAVMAALAVVVRAERVDFRYACHRRDKGRSYRATGSYQISVLIGLPHKLLSYDIHYGKAIGYD